MVPLSLWVVICYPCSMQKTLRASYNSTESASSELASPHPKHCNLTYPCFHYLDVPTLQSSCPNGFTSEGDVLISFTLSKRQCSSNCFFDMFLLPMVFFLLSVFCSDWSKCVKQVAGWMDGTCPHVIDPVLG